MSTTFSSLPDELIKNCIVPRFSVFIPDEHTLTLRAVCKRLYKLVPADGVSFRKRAKWLINGMPELWDRGKNSYETTCVRYFGFIQSVSYGDICFQGERSDWSVVHSTGHGTITIGEHGNLVMRYAIYSDKISDSGIDSDEEFEYVRERIDVHISTYCQFGQEVFFILADGTILRTPIALSTEETFRSFQTMTSGPQRKLSLSGHIHPMYRRFRSMQTSDGEHLLIVDMDGNLYMVNWSGSDTHETIAKLVQCFQWFDDIVVLLTLKGNLELMRLRFKNQMAEYSTVKMETEMAQHFLAVPSKQHLWILSTNGQIIKYSMPLPQDI